MIKKIFKGDYLKRLDNIKQWSEKDVFKQESVSQHSFKVTVFCRILLEEIFEREIGEAVVKFKLDCVTLAMLHDMDEALIRRDLSHDTKYNKFNGEDIRASLDSLSHHIAKEEFSEFCAPEALTATSTMLLDNIINVDQDVKIFVKFCDWLAIKFYIERELSLGNKQFESTLEYCKKSMSEVAPKVEEMLKRKFNNIYIGYPILYTLL